MFSPNPRRLLAGGLFALAVWGSACASSPSRGDAEIRFVAVHNAFAGMGMAQTGPIQRGSLAQGREVRLPVELASGCAMVVALGGDGVRDLDATLVDASGSPLGHDTTRDPQAVVRVCVDQPGSYALVVKMTEGAGEYLAATWSGGAIGASASGEGEGATARAGAPTGTCDSPIPITAGQYPGTTAHGESDNEASCASSSSRETVYRLDLATRQRATISIDDPHFDSVLYVRKDDCADVESEVACNDDVDHERRSRVDAVLDPGTYYVFVDGLANEAGTYRLKVALEEVPTLADVCRSSRALALGIAASGTTAGAFDSAQSTCGDGAKGGDVAYHFDLAARSRVRVSEKSSEFSPVVHLRKSCADESTEIACSEDGISDDAASSIGVLDPGSYTAFADSSGRDGEGRFTLIAETSPVQGAGGPGDSCSDAIALSGTGKIDGDTFSSRDDVSGSCAPAGGPDEIYRFDVAKRMRLTAHLTRQEGHHVFVLTRSCGDRAGEIACGGSVDQIVGPGTYFLAVDGATPSDFGRYSLEARLRDVGAQEAACRAPPLLQPGVSLHATTDGAGDKFTTSCGGREEIQSSADRIYRLELGQRAHVSLSLNTPTWDGVLVLRRSCMDLSSTGANAQTAEVRCNNDFENTQHAKIDMTLEPGAYFVLVDGHAAGNAGPFTLDYRILK